MHLPPSPTSTSVRPSLATRSPVRAACWLLAPALLALSPISGSARAEDPAEPADAEAAPTATGPAPGHSHVGEAFNSGPRQAARLIGGTGDVHLPITTSWTEGQTYFDQGVGQLHGFWYYEAERSFRQIAAKDPDCAMAYWGMSMANFENEGRARKFIEKAVERRDQASPYEQLWIDAQSRFLSDDPKDAVERRRRLIRDIEGIIHEHPDDIEAKAFLTCRIWQFSRQGLPISSHQSVDALLDQIFAADPDHPAHHYRIHLWDQEKAERALGSAAVLHRTAPAIAHMWHMPGHTYDKVKRYPESAWHQEASARVDHARMAEMRVLPDTIFNYAHNSEWLVRNWSHLGRVGDAVAFAKGMIENPCHPVLNHPGKGGSSSGYGRRRLLEVLERFECWDEALELADTFYLAPTDIEERQLERLRLTGIAAAQSGRREPLDACLAELATRTADLQAEKAKAEGEARAKAEEEGKQPEEIDKAVAGAVKPVDDRLGRVRKVADELGVFDQLARGEVPDEEGWKKLTVEKTTLARLQAEAGLHDTAVETAEAAVREQPHQILPLAIQAHVLVSADRVEEAEKVFATLRERSAFADLEAAPFRRLAWLAGRSGAPADWRPPVAFDADFGEKNDDDLASLGPLVYEPPMAPDLRLPEESGDGWSLADHRGRPVLLVFYLGHSCEHCVDQLNAFAPLKEQFDQLGIDLAAVSFESLDELGKAHDLCTGPDKRFPFPLLADPAMQSFRDYQAFDDFESLPLHGTFLIGPDGKLLWQDIGAEPFLEPKFLLEEAGRLLEIARLRRAS